MNIKRTIAALLALTTLTLAGCSSTESSANEQPVAETHSDPASEPTEEPAQSPALVPQGENGGGGFVTEEKKETATILIGADGRWDVATAYDVDGATGIELGKLANAFLNEHYFRRDRWQGRWTIKEGEMDAYREKVTPALFTEVNDALTTIDATYDEHGADAAEWPKKVLERAKKDAVPGAYLFMNTGTDDGGTGDYVYRITDRDIFRATAEDNWSGSWLGAPVTYVSFDATHKAGSTGPVKVVLFLGWKKVEGAWRIFRVGRGFDQ